MNETVITSAIPPHHPRVPQYVCATDNALRHIRTVSSQCVHCGCGLVPLVSCCLARQTTATALLLCCDACSGGFAVALLRLCCSSAAAQRQLGGRGCGSGRAHQRAALPLACCGSIQCLRAPAAATCAGSTASRAMPTIDTMNSTSTRESHGQDAWAAQPPVGRTAKGCRTQGEGTDALKLGRCVHCAIATRAGRAAQARRRGREDGGARAPHEE